MKAEYIPFVEELIELAIREDIGDGDHTSLSTIPADHHGRMRLLVKQEGIIAGIEVAKMVFNRLDPEVKFEQILNDGDHVKVGDVAFYVEGRTTTLLQSERIVLNIMQRMSGVATQTAVYVKEVEGTGCRVLDTRKTTPGMRIFEKYAVKVGGGCNHRYNLSDGILLKDNHIGAAGGVKEAVTMAIGSPNVISKGETTFIDKDNHDVVPVIKDSRTFVPLRFISEAFGMDVQFNSETREITISGNGIVLSLFPGEASINKNGVATQIDAPAYISGEGRTMVPLRAISEMLDKKVYLELWVRVKNDWRNNNFLIKNFGYE